MRRLLMLAATVGSFLVAGQPARADLITGSQGFGFDEASGNTGRLSTDTSFLLAFRTNGSQTGDFAGFPHTTLLPAVTLTVATISSFSFGSTDFGFFTGSFGEELAGGTAETREFVIKGTFTPGTNSMFAGLTSNSARLVVQINQSGGGGNAYGGGASLSVPFAGQPLGVPEPSSLVLLGSCCGPLVAAVWWRRRSKDAAA